MTRTTFLFRLLAIVSSVAVLPVSSIGCARRSFNAPPSEEAEQSGFNPHKLFGLGSPHFLKSLGAVLSLRCSQLLQEDAQAKLACLSSVNPFISALDFQGGLQKINGGGGERREVMVVVSFKTEFEAMMTDPEALAYLKELRDRLTMIKEFDTKTLDLWPFSLNHFKGDKGRALAHIAVLFQDLHARTQLKHAHLASKRNAAMETGVDLLDETLSLFIKMIPSGRLKTYATPEGEDREALYHFYVPAYIAYKMERNAPGDRGNRILPMVFNAEYEFQSIIRAQNPVLDAEAKKDPVFNAKVDGVLRSVVHVKKELVGEIAPFERSGREKTLQDIYNGYIGALFGAGGESAIEPYATFADRIAKDPKGTWRRCALSM